MCPPVKSWRHSKSKYSTWYQCIRTHTNYDCNDTDENWFDGKDAFDQSIESKTVAKAKFGKVLNDDWKAYIKALGNLVSFDWTNKSQTYCCWPWSYKIVRYDNLMIPIGLYCFYSRCLTYLLGHLFASTFVYKTVSSTDKKRQKQAKQFEW